MPRSSTAAGRRGALEEARELVTLVSSLSEAGDGLSVEAISSRLGVTRERARKLLSLVMSATAGDAALLPLVEDGPEEVSLVSDDATRGRAVRLTRAEAVALATALERIGLDEDDPTRRAVERALFASPVDEADVRRLLGTEGTAAGGVLATCAAAINERRGVTFLYRGAEDHDAARRTVLPRGLRSEEGTWYLDGWDLDRRAGRTFRLDRMSDAEPTATTPQAAADAPEATPANETAREVTVTFFDASYLKTLPWHALTVTEQHDDGTVEARIPYYGGDWLLRMLTACGGTAITTDAALTASVRAYAQNMLAVLDDAGGHE